jgi:hypothetical protein
MFPPVQAVEFVPEHCTQVPATHPGRAAVGQANVAPEPLSPLHPVHALLVVSQNAVAPVHAPVLVAVHCTQAPPLHAGTAAVGQGRVAEEPLSPLHC